MKLPFTSTYQQSNIGLLALTLLITLFAYFFTIQQTIHLKRNNKTMQNQLQQANTATQQIAYYNQQINQIDSNAVQAYNEDYLLAVVSTFCREHNLAIKDFPSGITYLMDKEAVVSHDIEVEGKYADMVKLAHALEQDYQLGSIVSLKFATTMDRREKKLYLRGRIILRNKG